MTDSQSVCEICGHDFVYVDDKTLQKIYKVLNPNFRSLQSPIVWNGNSLHPVCPCCDAYALGIELDAGFTFMTSSGQTSTIHVPEFRQRS